MGIWRWARQAILFIGIHKLCDYFINILVSIDRQKDEADEADGWIRQYQKWNRTKKNWMKISLRGK